MVDIDTSWCLMFCSSDKRTAMRLYNLGIAHTVTHICRPKRLLVRGELKIGVYSLRRETCVVKFNVLVFF
jgi:hypothetical protein